ncbi:DHHC palmitoyltransferase-domain-containing protein [Kockiozyma suomiensis]|uniref:DHHC palmitoyltransferase-domain-containing protein n=1 Tax=Kockiozyma suomiensis TaxID=1337062 RepID=UPI003343C5D1
MVMIWITYVLAIFVPPGSPPRPDFHPDEGLAKLSTFCKKCNAVKPPRAHHCRMCKTCVLRMDHHCPWTNNCVGHRNLPHFMRFLACAVWGLSSLLITLCGRIADLWASRHRPMLDSMITVAELTATLVMTPLTLLVWFSLVLLLIRTLWSLCVNTTMIESWERERVEGQIRKGRLPSDTGEFPYDLGSPLDNLRECLGPFLSWFNPFSEPDGDGMHFRMIEEADLDMPWPPADPDEIPVHNYSDLSQAPSTSSARAIVMERHISTQTPFFDERMSRATSSGDQHDQQYGWDSSDSGPDEGSSAEEYWRKDKWQSWEGERLEDFGVDTEAEVYSSTVAEEDKEEDIPLGVIKRKLATNCNRDA